MSLSSVCVCGGVWHGQRRAAVEGAVFCALGAPLPLLVARGGASGHGGRSSPLVGVSPCTSVRTGLWSSGWGPQQGAEGVLGEEEAAVAALLARLPALSLGHPGLGDAHQSQHARES